MCCHCENTASCVSEFFNTILLIAAICRIVHFGIITPRFTLEHMCISARQFQAPARQQAKPLLIWDIKRHSSIRTAQPLLLPAVPCLVEYHGKGAQADDYGAQHRQ